ncbi:MAG TPA: hypothetical protein VEI07_01300 [Planctomycetaceae bacterium]|nr:hypothetical protein [Planctomycetaceae bacterium]
MCVPVSWDGRLYGGRLEGCMGVGGRQRQVGGSIEVESQVPRLVKIVSRAWLDMMLWLHGDVFQSEPALDPR